MVKTPIALEPEAWDTVIHALEEELDQLEPQDEWIGEYPGEDSAVALADAYEEIMEQLSEGDDDRFDLLLEDVHPMEFVCLLGGVSSFAADALRARSETHIKAAGVTSEKLLESNPELTRAVLLSDEHGEYLSLAGEMSDDLKDDLDLEYVDGEWVDTREMTSIEIEGEEDA